jgi:hypothetical protein
MEDASRSCGKRKAAAFDALIPGSGGGKRRMEAPAPAPEERDWTSLHPDITRLIAERLLDEDVAEYIVFRAVCTHWRSSTPSPRDPTLADRRFHPRGWVALCEGTGVRPVDEEAITFFHTSTGRVRRLHLWELQGQRIVGFTDGLILLLDTCTAFLRVLHPFTRVVVQLPSLSRFFHLVLSKQASFKMDTFVWLNAAVCVASPSSIAVVVWFPNMPVVICAEPSSEHWGILHSHIQFTNTLPFSGRLYGVTRAGRQLVQIYPLLRKHVNPVVAEVPKDLGHPQNCCYYLVESMGAMVVAVVHKISGGSSCAFTVFKVDLQSQELTRVPNLRDQALFLNNDRCLSISANNFPSISSNSIYIALPKAYKPVVHSLNDGSFERLSKLCREHDRPDMIRMYVRPFTLADHLLTYCHHREWTRGLMFHEFYFIPCFQEKLRRRFAAQDSEVVVPRLKLPDQELKRLEIPNLFKYMSAWAKITGNRSRLTA